MVKQSLRAVAAALLRDLNTLIVGATVDELQDLMCALAATQAHVGALLLQAAADEKDKKDRPLTMPKVAEMLGCSEYTARERGRQGLIATFHDGGLVKAMESEVRRYIREHTHGVRERSPESVRAGLPGQVGAPPLAELPAHGRRARRGGG